MRDRVKKKVIIDEDDWGNRQITLLEKAGWLFPANVTAEHF